jgi:hypothetical protein
MMNSRFFASAAILGGALAIKFGGPLIAVALGIAVIGGCNWWAARRRVSRVK